MLFWRCVQVRIEDAELVDAGEEPARLGAHQVLVVDLLGDAGRRIVDYEVCAREVLVVFDIVMVRRLDGHELVVALKLGLALEDSGARERHQFDQVGAREHAHLAVQVDVAVLEQFRILFGGKNKLQNAKV